MIEVINNIGILFFMCNIAILISCLASGILDKRWPSWYRIAEIYFETLPLFLLSIIVAIAIAIVKLFKGS